MSPSGALVAFAMLLSGMAAGLSIIDAAETGSHFSAALAGANIGALILNAILLARTD